MTVQIVQTEKGSKTTAQGLLLSGDHSLAFLLSPVMGTKDMGHELKLEGWEAIRVGWFALLNLEQTAHSVPTGAAGVAWEQWALEVPSLCVPAGTCAPSMGNAELPKEIQQLLSVSKFWVSVHLKSENA